MEPAEQEPLWPAARWPVTSLQQWRRLREIATLLSASGFDWLVAAVGLSACVRLSCRWGCRRRDGECRHAATAGPSTPERAVAVLEQLGPTFVKVGQLLAMRPDVVPAAFAEAMRALQDRVAPFSWEQARAVLTTELHRPPEQVFAEFEEVPFAAASLCQVHRARLVDGTAVAVKVQRPGVAAQMAADLALLGALARRLERRRGSQLGVRPTLVVAELADFTRRELDFRREARTSETVRTYFAGDDTIIVPGVEWDLTTSRVLTMEFVEGVRPAPRAELAAVGLDPDRLLRVGAGAMLRQIFDLGLFHADPHPGNLLMLAGSRVAFLDFGMFGRLEPRERRRMARVLWALVEGDDDAVADQLLHLAGRRLGADPRGFRADLAEMVEQWRQAPDRPSVARLLLRELRSGAAHGIEFPRELMLLARSLLSLEATAALVDPERTFVDLARELLPDLQRMLLPDRTQLDQLVKDNWFDYLALALELPELLPHLRDALTIPAAASPALPSVGSRRLKAMLALAGGATAGAAVSRRAHVQHVRRMRLSPKATTPSRWRRSR